MGKMGKILKLNRFDPAKRGKDGKSAYLGFFILLNGKRRSGKTTVAIDLMYHMRDDIDLAIAMCPTSGLNGCLEGIIPHSFQYKHGDPKYILELLQVQEARKKQGKMKSILLFLDDLAWDSSFMKSEGFKELLFNGRHYGITVIFTVQYCMVLSQELRMQCDLVVTMMERSFLGKENLHKQFFNMMSMREFLKVLIMCTKGYSALILDNQSREEELSQFIFWFVADPNHASQFRLGSDAMWQLDEFYSTDTPEEDPRAAAEEAASDEGREPERVEYNDPVLVGETIDMIAMADRNGQTVVCTDVETQRHRH